MRELKHHHPGVFEQILLNLKSCTSPTHPDTQICPTLFLSLMITSKLYPDPGTQDGGDCGINKHVDNGDGDDGDDGDGDDGDMFGKYIFCLLSSPLLKLRNVAARALVLVCPTAALDRFVSSCSSIIAGSCLSNQLNGILMFLYEYCKLYPNSFVTHFINVGKLRKDLKNERLLAINKSLILQIFITLRKAGLVSFEIDVRFKSENIYPSNLLDYLGIWHIEGGNNEIAFKHIQEHYHSLTGIFWESLNIDFYHSISAANVVWLLTELPSSRYAKENLVHCAFTALNSHYIPDLDIPADTLNHLSENVDKYRSLCTLLSVSYNMETFDNARLALTAEELSFDTCNVDYLGTIYTVSQCNYNTPLVAHILATATLYVQSEDENLRSKAITFCMSHCCSRGLRSCHVTSRYALECVGDFVRGLDDLAAKKEYVAEFNDIRDQVLSRNCRGLSVQCNAHFDKKLFLELTEFN